jgi:cysteine-rich repeat protein
MRSFRRRRHALFAAILCSSVVTSAVVADATPLRLDYLVSDAGGGLYGYDFTLELDDNDASWAAAQGFGWVVFGDCSPSCTSPLTGFAGTSVESPWVAFATTTGVHNGPTLSPTGSFWVPAAVGETRSWSGTSTANLTQGNLLWSNLLSQNGSAMANLVVATRLAPDCGNGIVDPGETCDDGNIRKNDCCGADCIWEGTDVSCDDGDVCTVDDLCDGAGTCISGDVDPCDDDNLCSVDSCVPMSGCVHGDEPATGCITAESSQFQVKYPPLQRYKDKLKWKFKGGPAVVQADLGQPNVDTKYALCVYDETLATPARVASIEIAPGSTTWETKDPKGFAFKTKSEIYNGVSKVSLKTGEDGTSSASLLAKGNNVPMPEPVGMVKYMNMQSKVTVQLINDATSTCWQSEFTSAKKNTGQSFLAKTP